MEFVLESDSSGVNTQEARNDFRQRNMFETQTPTFRSRRNSRTNVATSHDDVEFTQPVRTRKRAPGPKVQYVEAVKKTRSRKKIKAKQKIEWTWNKVGWLMCAALIARLVFMEGGLIDFNSMDNAIAEKYNNLAELKAENQALTTEIHKIRTSPQYQKKITREHLGVIAQDEYLVLFSKER